MIHFIRPYWFLALIPLLMLLWQLRHYLFTSNNWQHIIDKHLLPHLLLGLNKKATYWPLTLLSLIWMIVVFALAGPSWTRLPQTVFQSNNAKVIVLDLSQNMLASDVRPDRLTRAQYKIIDILNNFREGQTGLVVFTSEAYNVSPLTNDSETISGMVPQLSPSIVPVLGSDITAGLQNAAELFKQSNIKKGLILLVTASDPSQRSQALAKQLHQQGFTISVLGVATPQGAPLPDANGGFVTNANQQPVVTKLNTADLEKLADNGGGRFSAFANTSEDIHYLLQPTLAEHQLTASQTTATTTLWKDEGRWFVLLLLPLFLLFFRSAWLTQ
jgi:Ca-activated chloride channel family protein